MILSYPVLSNFILGLVLASAMVGLAAVGRRIGARHAPEDPGDTAGLSLMEGAVFALFGLLMALTFTGAVDRFQIRKNLILREAQALGTAYLRLDLLPEPAGTEAKQALRSYLARRLDAYTRIADPVEFEAEIARSDRDGAALWKAAVEGCREKDIAPYAEVVLPAINDVLDIGLARQAALRKHPPAVIYGFLFLMALASAFLGGFAMARAKHPSRIHIVAFAVMIALTICVTLDIEAPRFGLIRIDSADATLQRVLDSMR